jgi:hypothetical protein
MVLVFLKKNPLAGEVGVRRVFKPGEGSFLMKTCETFFLKLGDTSRVVAGVFKQNFKVQCESRNNKVIA